MNTENTKKFVDANRIVAIKADKGKAEKEIDDLLRKLGNTSGAIPFYAIFPAGRPNEPILMDGIITESKIIEALKKAGPSLAASPPSENGATAMRSPESQSP